MKFLEPIRAFLSRILRKNSNQSEAVNTSSQELKVGVDTGTAGGDKTVFQVGEILIERLNPSLRLPILRFRSFLDAKRLFPHFRCDGLCNTSSGDCYHAFEFPCPGCRLILQFEIEEMRLLVDYADETTVCAECWAKSGEQLSAAA